MTASLTRSLAVYSDGSLSEPGLQLYQVKHDYELYKLPDGSVDTSKLRQNMPEVFRLEPFHYTAMTQPIQEFMFSLLGLELAKVGVTDLELVKYTWSKLYGSTTAFANGQGVDIRRDYIRGINLDQPLPGLMSIICGGNVLTGIETTAKWGSQVQPCLQVEAIVAQASMPDYRTRDEAPTKIQYATICTLAELPDRTYKVTRFSAPAYQGANSPVPVLVSQQVYFPLRLLKKLPMGADVPSPYNYG